MYNYIKNMEYISKAELLEFINELPDDSTIYLGCDYEIEDFFGGEYPEDYSLIMEADGTLLIATSIAPIIETTNEDSNNYIPTIQESSKYINNLDIDSLFNGDEEIPSVTVNFHNQ